MDSTETVERWVLSVRAAQNETQTGFRACVKEKSSPPYFSGTCNTKGYSSTYLAMGFANVRAGTLKRRAVFGYPPEHLRIP